MDPQTCASPYRPSAGQLWGLARSLLMYYGNPLQARRMARFYGALIRPGDLCFDIGAHVGNRVCAWTQLGAQVVAVEPQPICLWFLRKWYGRHPLIHLVDAAVGAKPGAETLLVSNKTPTVTTLSQSWIDAIQTVDSFAAVQWEERVSVPVITLDTLIERYGVPAFCKIDVEGYELEVLRGLSQPLDILSFEYIPAAVDIAQGCIDRLAELDTYTYNWTVGEQHRSRAERRLGAQEMRDLLAGLPPDANSGDVYAFRQYQDRGQD